MRIRGAEGLTDEQLKAELDRGGRFVVFNWTVSLLVMTFKRSSAIYFVRPGSGAFLPNFFCSLTTIVLGWWGIPWGPAYSLQSLWNNLHGGIDVTSAVFNHTAPTTSADPRTMAGPRFSAVPLVAALAAALIVLAVFFGDEALERRNIPAALVNGLDTAYAVAVNGTQYWLEPRSILQLRLGAGDFSVSALLPGGLGESRFKFSTGNVLTSPFERKAVIINPDAAAPVVSETIYYSVNENLQPAESPKPAIMSGRQFYVVNKPDYFISEFPESVSMPPESPYVSRTRIFPLNQLFVGYVASILNDNEGRQAMLDYFDALGRLLPNREEVLAAAVEALDPEETGLFFEPGLAVRPPLLQWHLYFQQYSLRHHPEKDIIAVYLKQAEENPDDGALAYLYGRLLDDPAEARHWFERALAAKKPCAYANISIALDLAGQGEFKPALDALAKARAAGADSEFARTFWSECLLALGRFEEAWRDYVANADRKDGFKPDVFTEMKFAFLARGKEEAAKVIDRVMKELPGEFHVSRQGQDSPADIIRRGFEQKLAYLDGDAGALAKGISDESSPSDRFIAAICSGDLAKAEVAMDEMPDATSYLHLILYLEAARQSDITAYRHWKSSVEAMKKEPGFNAKLASRLTGEAPMETQEILAAPILLFEKRVVLAALGIHDQANREVFFDGAQKANIDPAFPSHLIEEVTEIL